jgi:hypothetical protein
MGITLQKILVEVIKERLECVCMIFRAQLHILCMIKNPSKWRFYLKGILREFGIDLSKN